MSSVLHAINHVSNCKPMGYLLWVWVWVGCGLGMGTKILTHGKTHTHGLPMQNTRHNLGQVPYRPILCEDSQGQQIN